MTGSCCCLAPPPSSASLAPPFSSSSASHRRGLKRWRVFNPNLVASSRFRPLHFSSASRSRGAFKKLGWRVDHRVLCFKDAENSYFGDNGGIEFGELPEELENPNSNKPGPENKNWIFNILEIANRSFTIRTEPWTVPWTAETIIQVMLLWISSFWFVGSWIIPFLAHAAGFSKASLSHRGQALYTLLTDIAEGLIGVAILHRCLSRFRPLPSGWFPFHLKGTWHFDVGLGCLFFPLVNFLSQINISIVPALPAPSIGVSSVEQSIVARDPVAMALYVVVVSVCAPVWEEIVFRGFLLPSLTRYMPLPLSIVASAVAFALVHFNAQRLLPLVFLGVVMGVVFTKSRNLLASMLLHSLWNGFVFLDLMK